MTAKHSLLSNVVVKPAIGITTVVLALASPAGAVSAQFSFKNNLEQFKTAVNTAIDKSITKLQESSESLNYSIDVKVDKNGVVVNGSGPAGTVSGSAGKDGVSGSANVSGGGASGSASGSVSKDGASGQANGQTKSSSGSASGSVNTSGSESSITFDAGFLQGLLSVPKELKQKLQQSNEKAIERLKDLKAEIAATASLNDLELKAKAFDQQFKEIATANVQATVTKSIDSQTKVLDRLQLAANAIQTQVTKLKECVEGVSVTADGSADASSASGSINASAPGCTSLNVDANSGDAGASLQATLDEIKSSLKTIRSFLSSSISLVAQLKEGNYSGTIKSFQGISSQVDIVASLSADVQNDLLNLSAAVNK